MIKTLTTERLRLRAITPIDAGKQFRMFSDPECARNMGADPPKNLAAVGRLVGDLVRFNNSGIAYHWIIETAQNDQVIGCCNIFAPAPHLVAWKERQIGYALLKEAWGRGYMTEALAAVLDFALSTQGIFRLQAHISGHNTRSINVVERLGFQFEGVERGKGMWCNQRHDMHSYALLADEWNNPRQAHFGNGDSTTA